MTPAERICNYNDYYKDVMTNNQKIDLIFAEMAPRIVAHVDGNTGNPDYWILKCLKEAYELGLKANEPKFIHPNIIKLQKRLNKLGNGEVCNLNFWNSDHFYIEEPSRDVARINIEGPIVARIKNTMIEYLQTIDPLPSKLIEAIKSNRRFGLDDGTFRYYGENEKIPSGITECDWDKNYNRIGQHGELINCVEKCLTNMANELQEQINKHEVSEEFELSEINKEKWL